jgi:rRNA maturation RNase YbeY
MDILVDFKSVDAFYVRESDLSAALVTICEEYNLIVGSVSFIFCDDSFLLDINRAYLNHDYYTDIITFDYTEDGVISGDLLISVDTVLSNSLLYSSPYEIELFRVLVHGLLHLCGLSDKEDGDVLVMRNAESRFLGLCANPFVSRET